MKIFINAGHGGKDSGAISPNGLKEKDICRTICSILTMYLIEQGFQVEFFQQKNSLSEISKTENRSLSDLFISVHCNSFTDSNVNGIETLYHPLSVKGKNLAQIINKSLVAKTGLRDRGIKLRENLHVLNRTRSPAVLVECGFLSNKREEELLKTKPELFAQGICEGLKFYRII